MKMKSLVIVGLLLSGLLTAVSPSVAADTATSPAGIEADGQTCQAPPASCGGDESLMFLFTAESTGPGDSCCSRHLEMAEALCLCGVSSFNCFPNGRGGCSSSWRCEYCPV